MTSRAANERRENRPHRQTYCKRIIQAQWMNQELLLFFKQQLQQQTATTKKGNLHEGDVAAVGEPAGVLEPRVVVGFPVAQAAVAVEALDVVAGAQVEEAGAGHGRRPLLQRRRPGAVALQPRLQRRVRRVPRAPVHVPPPQRTTKSTRSTRSTLTPLRIYSHPIWGRDPFCLPLWWSS